VFERLRDALRAALDAATPPGNLRDLARQMREAVVEAKLSVQETRQAVSRTEGELAVERQRLADAERRGRLAGEIQDHETVEVAHRFAAKHRERVGVLERKLAALRDELALYERELGDMQAQLARAETGRSRKPSARPSEPGATCRRRAARGPGRISRTSCSSPPWTARRARPPPTGSSRTSRRR